MVYLEVTSPSAAASAADEPHHPPLPAFKRCHTSSNSLYPPSPDLDRIRSTIRTLINRRASEEADLGIEQLRSLLTLTRGSYEVDESTFVDAGDVDPRLRGCGRVSPAVRSAVTAYVAGHIDDAELLTVASKDLAFQSVQVEGRRREEVGFWRANDSWDQKKEVRVARVLGCNGSLLLTSATLFCSSAGHQGGF